MNRHILRKTRDNNPGGASFGMALGGGGVRGLAHAGVLSALTRENIPIRAIAGSSMGAIVASAFALNAEFDHKDFAEHMRELGARVPNGFGNSGRENESFLQRLRRFIEAEKIIVDASVGWGALSEREVAKILEQLTRSKRLEDGRVELAIVATDLLRGEKFVFETGPAALAVQASSAIPGFLPPVKFEDRLLADGAFVDLVPTQVVRQMGVDFVIAVDVDQEGMPVEVNNGIEAFLRATEICSRHHKRHHLELADFVIRPDFGGPINPLDVSKVDLCIEAGIEAADRIVPKLRAAVGL